MREGESEEGKREGGRQGGREGVRERGRSEMEGGREGGREEDRNGEREGRREGGREGSDVPVRQVLQESLEVLKVSKVPSSRHYTVVCHLGNTRHTAEPR